MRSAHAGNRGLQLRDVRHSNQGLYTMKYVVIFVHNTGRYSCHAQNCRAATKDDPHSQSLIPESFDTIAAAQAWANADESQKAGKPTEAIWRVCGCTKEV